MYYSRLSLLLPLLLALAPLSSAAITLKIATIAPQGSSWMSQMRDGAVKVQRRTEGRVSFRFYPGGIMGNDQSVLRKIRVGQLQGGAVAIGSLVGIYPDIQIYGLPFLFHSYDEVDYVRSRMDDTLLAGLKEHGFVSFGFGEGGFAYLMSKDPIRSTEDLTRQKVWIPEGDRVSQAAFEAMGVSPIPLPLTDVLTGLQTGLVDTVATSCVGAIALQWHTRVKYLTDTPLLYLYGTLVIDRKAFARLSPQDQAIVRETMDEVIRAMDHQSRTDDRQARKALRQQGITFIEPPAQDLRRLYEIEEAAVERLGAQGQYTPAMLATLKGYLNDYRTQGSRVSSAGQPPQGH